MEAQGVDGILRGVREMVRAAAHLACETARLAASEPECPLVGQARAASIDAARAAFALDDALREPLSGSTLKVVEEAMQAAEAANAASRAILGHALPEALAAVLAVEA